jgi:hypothetical protein
MTGHPDNPFHQWKDVLEGVGVAIADPIPNTDNANYPITLSKMSRSLVSCRPLEFVVAITKETVKKCKSKG